MRVRTGAVLGAALVALAITSASARAAETRAEYVAKADDICKKSQQRARHVFRKLGPTTGALPDPDDDGEPTRKERRALVKNRTRLIRILGTTNAIFGRMVSNIALVPVPAGDGDTAVLWIGGMRAYKQLLDRALRAFKQQKPRRFLLFFLRGLEAIVGAATVVEDWGFRNCPGAQPEKQRITSSEKSALPYPGA